MDEIKLPKMTLEERLAGGPLCRGYILSVWTETDIQELVIAGKATILPSRYGHHDDSVRLRAFQPCASTDRAGAARKGSRHER